MDNSTVRAAICSVLALACVIQTSLIVIFTVTHVQQQRQLQMSYDNLTQRARRLLLSCGGAQAKSRTDTDDSDDVKRVRESRQVHPDLVIQHLIEQQEGMLERHCSNDTKLCLPGPKGDAGRKGERGAVGGPGPRGEQGPKGTQGPIGDTGPQGVTGGQGPTGPKGEPGEPGPTGPKGRVGLLGSRGARGPKGAPGKVGAKGQPGAKGEVGPVGAHGDPGVRGQPGPKGDPGPAGPRGEAGPVGAQGEAGSPPPGSNCSCFFKPQSQGRSAVQLAAFPGSTLTLSCPITGSPAPDVTWSRAPALPSDAVSKGKELIIPNMKSDDVGLYTCTATNILGTTVVTFNVTFSDTNCDFESGYCAWTQGTQDQLDWHLNKGMTNTILTGPSVDHTLETVAGQYAYLESSQGTQGDVADLQSPPLMLSAPLCLQFWYSMYGADINTLSVLAKSPTGNEALIWSKSGDQGQGWQHAQVSVIPESDGEETRIVFRASRGLSLEGDIAIDDIRVISGMCIQPPDSINCNFQTDMCGWSDSGQWRWAVRKGPSGKPNTGPLADRNGNAGQFYAYEDGSSVSTAGSKGRLESPFIDASTPVCVEFFYHMFGSGEGSLSFIIKSQDRTEYVLWQRSGDQTQQWHHAQLTLPQTSLPYSLVFEATRGSNAASDVAVDDVNVTSGECPGIGDLGCDFELLDLCTWAQETSKDNLDWDVQVASTGGQNGAPGLDHTLQTDRGHYVSVSSKGHNQGDEAVLRSRTLPRTTIYCMSLWYDIPASGSGSISIFREVFESRTEKLRTISYKPAASGQQPGWTHISFSIPSYWTDFALVLVATTGDSAARPLAVDDVSLKTGVCQ